MHCSSLIAGNWWWEFTSSIIFHVAIAAHQLMQPIFHSTRVWCSVKQMVCPSSFIASEEHAIEQSTWRPNNAVHGSYSISYEIEWIVVQARRCSPLLCNYVDILWHYVSLFVMHVHQRVSLPPISLDYVVWAYGICDAPIIVDCRVHCILYHHSWCISNSIYYRCTSHIIMRMKSLRSMVDCRVGQVNCCIECVLFFVGTILP